MKKQETLEIMARQKEEIQATKTKLQEMHGKHMAEIKSAVKVHEEKLANSKQLLQELQAKYDKLLHERDTAVTEAKELRQKNKQSVSVTTETPYTEFPFVELQKATNGFDAEFKISEDEFASIYKSFIRNTNVAIKLFHPRSLKGQAKFYQEVITLLPFNSAKTLFRMSSDIIETLLYMGHRSCRLLSLVESGILILSH